MIKVFIIPGNPGISSYYEEFKYDLSKVLDFTKFKIKILNYYNFLNKNKNYSIYEELNNIKEQILESTNSKDEIILIGHSIGGWVCLNLIEDLEKQNINVIECILLFPFLKTNNKNIKQFVFRKMLSYNPNKFVYLKNLLISNISKNMTPYSRNITEKMFKKTNDYILISYSFAKTYVDNLDYNMYYINKYYNKIYMAYTSNDIWCTKQDFSALKDYVYIDTMNDVSHDFCTKDQEIKIVVNKIKNYLTNKNIIKND